MIFKTNRFWSGTTSPHGTNSQHKPRVKTNTIATSHTFSFRPTPNTKLFHSNQLETSKRKLHTRRTRQTSPIVSILAIYRCHANCHNVIVTSYWLKNQNRLWRLVQGLCPPCSSGEIRTEQRRGVDVVDSSRCDVLLLLHPLMSIRYEALIHLFVPCTWKINMHEFVMKAINDCSNYDLVSAFDYWTSQSKTKIRFASLYRSSFCTV